MIEIIPWKKKDACLAFFHPDFVTWYLTLLQLYMSNQSEEQQKYGERVAYLQEATNKHNEAMKMSKVSIFYLFLIQRWY